VIPVVTHKLVIRRPC